MKSYKEFVDSKKYDIENRVDEGLFDVFKKLFGKIKQHYNNTKGGKEIKAIYELYKKTIMEQIKKQAGVDLNLNVGDGEMTPESNNNFKNIMNFNTFINEISEVGYVNGLTEEAEAAQAQSGTTVDTKTLIANLKKKTVLIDKIVELYINMAIKKMTQILTKYGGAEKNPKLQVLLTNSIDQLRLDVLSAKVQYLEVSGDKTMVAKIKMERDALAKKVTNSWNSIGAAGDVEKGGQLTIGVLYRYKTDKGIKTIKITKQSTTEGKIFATYLVADDGELSEQEFRIENIDTSFKPVVGTKYNYFNDKEIVPVEVKAFDETSKKLTLTTDSGEFEGHIGALRDVVGAVDGVAPTTESPEIVAAKAELAAAKAVVAAATPTNTVTDAMNVAVGTAQTKLDAL